MTEELVFGREEARQYEAWFGTNEGQRVDRLEKSLLRQFLVDLQGSQPGTMLEVACGTGHFSRYFDHELKWGRERCGHLPSNVGGSTFARRIFCVRAGRRHSPAIFRISRTTW